ncbi:hypothetical protein ACH4TV_41130 [Streptomyces sp. NPDC020898]|uniref:hypothetical protein n=1 Tax=Streptomyces sp. NPDC020898 TaxID=3365101 RepID=UPI00378ACD0C
MPQIEFAVEIGLLRVSEPLQGDPGIDHEVLDAPLDRAGHPVLGGAGLVRGELFGGAGGEEGLDRVDVLARDVHRIAQLLRVGHFQGAVLSVRAAGVTPRHVRFIASDMAREFGYIDAEEDQLYG